jgi:hypothetical protein
VPATHACRLERLPYPRLQAWFRLDRPDPRMQGPVADHAATASERRHPPNKQTQRRIMHWLIARSLARIWSTGRSPDPSPRTGPRTSDRAAAPHPPAAVPPNVLPLPVIALRSGQGLHVRSGKPSSCTLGIMDGPAGFLGVYGLVRCPHLSHLARTLPNSCL